MQLTLDGIVLRAGSQTHLYPMSLAPVAGAMTVLLGATLAGKTSLMRIMAGLDRPTEGRVRVDGVDVTGVPVRQRNVAMVYQQFINYPSMSVYDNIASPLKLRGARDTREKVHAMAARLHIDHLLDRYPSELSGGQQQRVALARALAKEAPLILLDEPLVNLDYKLREELRDELSELFAEGRSTVVYATTEPGEALLLGGHTAVLDAGELLQYGPTAEVFHRPNSIRVARAFSDPPMNLFAARRHNGGFVLQGDVAVERALPPGADADITAGLRAGALDVTPRPGHVALPGRVTLAEISGSDTFVHAATAAGDVVAQLPGVHRYSLDERVALYFDPAQTYAFGADGALLTAPRQPASAGEAA
ncbi:ABC transporter ATP-binding protein [Achromobacter sp. NFACC18-2]|uniref:ABC transporter ATP-binding protein n=1 Tax=Achromobacter sp. NFACC18-2 TaxID=1564112 RepID=UPI0008AC472D|nr:ABC transporter ATP-binding protein [Achromobacter sp. NFACC18-2]SEI40277.1 carbohydrate ABC transporter ATP-binding protein, CUT1 family (TC 3.A.1.1.-) [Achromobacter sp. NFACC18-2]